MALSSRHSMATSRKTQPTSRKTLPAELIFNSEHNERKWFHKHGKQNFLCLSDKVMDRLRHYFNALDSHKCESISSEDLEDPLIVFGLCENRDEVQKIVKVIDTDSSGVIQFDEFVQIFKAAKYNKKQKASKIKFEQFANIITGKVGKQLQNCLGIQTSISQYRRKAILEFLKRKNQNVVANGKRIAKQIAIKSDRQDLLPALHKFQ